MIIYAVTNGLHRRRAGEQGARVGETGFHAYMAAQYPQVGEALRREKAMSKGTEAMLKQAIAAYKQTVA